MPSPLEPAPGAAQPKPYVRKTLDTTWPLPQPCGCATALYRRFGMANQTIHEHAAPLSDAVQPNRSRRLIKCAKESETPTNGEFRLQHQTPYLSAQDRHRMTRLVVRKKRPIRRNSNQAKSTGDGKSVAAAAAKVGTATPSNLRFWSSPPQGNFLGLSFSCLIAKNPEASSVRPSFKHQFEISPPAWAVRKLFLSNKSKTSFG